MSGANIGHSMTKNQSRKRVAQVALSESAGLAEVTAPLMETVITAPEKRSGGRWLVTIGKPGKGQGGTYSADLLRTYGPLAYPARTKSYFKHNLPQDRDPRDQLGSFPEGAFWNEAEQKLQAELKPLKRWQPLLEEMAESDTPMEMSMYCLNWELDNDGNVIRIGPHQGNTVDAVGFAGLEGSAVEARLESLVESARAAYDHKPAASGGQEKEDEMEIKELSDKLDGHMTKLTGLFESFVASQQEKKQTEAQAKVDAEAIAAAETAAVEAYSARIALVESARKELLPSQVESLMESAKAGVDVAPLVESAKKVYQEAQSVLAESLGDGGRTLAGTSDVKDATELGKVF